LIYETTKLVFSQTFLKPRLLNSIHSSQVNKKGCVYMRKNEL